MTNQQRLTIQLFALALALLGAMLIIQALAGMKP